MQGISSVEVEGAYRAMSLCCFCGVVCMEGSHSAYRYKGTKGHSMHQHSMRRDNMRRGIWGLGGAVDLLLGACWV